MAQLGADRLQLQKEVQTLPYVSDEVDTYNDQVGAETERLHM